MPHDDYHDGPSPFFILMEGVCICVCLSAGIYPIASTAPPSQAQKHSVWPKKYNYFMNFWPDIEFLFFIVSGQPRIDYIKLYIRTNGL